jgi:chemotaxis protein CheD
MEFLINSILSKGGRRNCLEFKLFGGGNITGSADSIGKYNVKFIKDYMKTEGYSIAAESLGGSHPIILNYSPKTGVAKIRRLDQKTLEIVTSEQSYLHKLETERIEGDIELFNGDK